MSEIIGIGVDLCDIARMEKAIQKENFLKRVFTPQENAYLESKGKSRAQSAAALYAAKEAVCKALGTGFSGGIMPEQIEVLHTELGAPVIRLHGQAEERFQEMNGKALHVSLSHESGMAIAFVTAS
ncbi:MAG: holo-ACP synthase [Clostridia bacterium]|nr:holo-ACP synthase [Clostridia bacterium]